MLSLLLFNRYSGQSRTIDESCPVAYDPGSTALIAYDLGGSFLIPNVALGDQRSADEEHRKQ